MRRRLGNNTRIILQSSFNCTLLFLSPRDPSRLHHDPAQIHDSVLSVTGMFALSEQVTWPVLDSRLLVTSASERHTAAAINFSSASAVGRVVL